MCAAYVVFRCQGNVPYVTERLIFVWLLPPDFDRARPVQADCGVPIDSDFVMFLLARPG